MKRWPTKPLRELIAIEKGKKAPEVLTAPTKTSLRYLQIEDLRSDANLKFCEPFNCPRATKSDAILAWDGANAGTVSCNLEGHIGSTLAVLRPVEANTLSAVFLSRFLQGNFEYLQKTATGATIPHVSKHALTTLRIPVPPLAEQDRIVKLLDKADELRKLRAQADLRTANLIPALFHEMFGDETAESSKLLGEVCLKITDGVHITPTYVDEGVPFLRVTDIQDDEIDWTRVKRIPETEYEQITKRVKPEQGDILYSKNGTIGIAKEIRWERPFAHFVSLALLKPNRNVLNPTFLTAWLNTPDALRQAMGRSKTGTVTNLHLNEIRNMRIPCPSMEMQVLFVQRVTEIRELEAEQAASRHRLDNLLQSALHRSFQGEL